MSSKPSTAHGSTSGSGSDKSSKSGKATSSSSSKPAIIPKLALDAKQESEEKARNVAPLIRSVSQMLPSQLLPKAAHATLTARGTQIRRIPTPAAQPGATASATFSVRVFITSDWTPHRFCALVIKPGWQWDDFLEAATAKLAGGAQIMGSTGSLNLSAVTANAVFLQSGAEVSTLDDLRDDDQVLLRFQKRMSTHIASIPLSGTASVSSSANTDEIPSQSELASTKHSEDDLTSYIPMDGVFRVLLPELCDVSPLSFSDELIADLVQDEMRQLNSFDAKVTAVGAEKSSLRVLLRDLLLTSETLPPVVLRTYDYLLPHHTFLSILIVHLRAPLVPMEAMQHQQHSGNTPVRPQPPQGRSTSVLPTFGMSVQLTDPIRRGAAQSRIINVIKQWVELRFATIRDDLATLELLDDLIVYLCASPDRLRNYGEAIANTFKTARKHALQIERDLALCSQDLLVKERVTYSRAVEVSPFELASQLTLADQDHFMRVNLAELQAQQFDLTERNLSPHIVNWVNHSTFITSWVVASILGPPGDPNPGPKRRGQILQHFIAAMDELRAMRSYNAMMQIYHALVHPAIDRLEATWDTVSAGFLATKAAIADVIKPPSSQGYHNMVNLAEPPCIPYIEYHLNELRHVETLETIFADGAVNLAKFDRLSKSFQAVTRLQRATYNLIPNPSYMTFIRTYDVPAVSTLIDLSLSLEADSSTAAIGGGGGGGGGSPLMAGGRIVVRPASRSVADRNSSSSGQAAASAASSSSSSAGSPSSYGDSPLIPGKGKAAAAAIKERKRKDSSTLKLLKEKEKEEEKRRKKWDKQAKKIRPLLTAALSIEQAILNSDIYEQFLSYSNDASFVNALTFYKAVTEFKRMFGSDVEPAARRTRDEAARIAATHLPANGGDKIPDFSHSVEPKLKDIDAKAKSEQTLFTNNLFDPLVADLIKMLSTSFVLFKAQRTV